MLNFNLLGYWRGKIIGGIFGAMLAGPVGFLLGILIGHVFDRGWRNLHVNFNPGQQQQAQQAFFNATFRVMGYIAKADGRVSSNEINAALNIMQRLNLTEAQRQQAMLLFNQGKQVDFNFQAALQTLLQQCGRQRALLQLFAECQLQAALVDGQLNAIKKQLLQQLYQQLGFGMNWFILEQFFAAQQNSGQRYHQSSYQNTFNQRSQTTSLEQAYTVLNIKNTATAAEIKRAYRQQMSQNHPDKLVAKGLPEEMIKLATEKTQKIQAAYEQICRARGM